MNRNNKLIFNLKIHDGEGTASNNARQYQMEFKNFCRRCLPYSPTSGISLLEDLRQWME